MFFIFGFRNNVKAHLMSYPSLVGLYLSELRFFSVGFLFSLNIVSFIIFVYAIRQHFYNTNAPVLTSMFYFILTESLTFLTFCVCYYYSVVSNSSLDVEGIILLSSRKAILTITFIFFVISCNTIGYHYLVGKGINFKIINSILLMVLTTEIFLSIQILDYVHNSSYINDAITGSITYILLGIHLVHLFFGLVLILMYFVRRMYMYTTNKVLLTSFNYGYIVYPQSDLIVSIFMMFLELLWLIIKYMFYM